MQKALLILLLVLPAIFAADCPTGYKPATQQQRHKHNARGKTIFAVQGYLFDGELPAMIQDLSVFDAQIRLECVNGAGSYMWHAKYKIGTSQKTASIFEYPTDCVNKYRQAKAFSETHFHFGTEDPIPGINTKCTGAWRVIQNTANEKEVYIQLSDQVVDEKLMPYSKKNMAKNYCAGGFTKMNYEETGACFKKKDATVRVNRITYGKGAHVGRVWGNFRYQCYGDTKERVVRFSTIIPYDVICSWNVTMISSGIMIG